jgi:hypothetical protein
MYSIGKAHLHAQFNLSIVIILCCFFYRAFNDKHCFVNVIVNIGSLTHK